MKSFIKFMPNYVAEVSGLKPNRTTETITFSRILARHFLKGYLNNSLYFSMLEQNAHDAELEVLRCGYQSISVLRATANLMCMTSKRVSKLLDRCTAICTYRDLLGLDPIPERHYPNIYNGKLTEVDQNILKGDLDG